jgi:hypothetical protein
MEALPAGGEFALDVSNFVPKGIRLDVSQSLNGVEHSFLLLRQVGDALLHVGNALRGGAEKWRLAGGTPGVVGEVAGLGAGQFEIIGHAPMFNAKTERRKPFFAAKERRERREFHFNISNAASTAGRFVAAS